MPDRNIIVIDPIPDFQPTEETREQVAKMVACGLDEIDIAFFLRIEPLTVRRVFAQELKHGTAYWVAKVGSAMIDSGMRGDVNAQRAFLQMRGRWAAPTRAEADNDEQASNIQEKRRLMRSIIDMVVGTVTEAETVTPKKANKA